MERTELEKLMDRYKKEMLEFSRKNGGKNLYDAKNSGMNTLDERERQLEDAVENNTPYELDRSDPLPEIKPEEKAIEKIDSVKEEKVIPVQAEVYIPTRERTTETVDVREQLRDTC